MSDALASPTKRCPKCGAEKPLGKFRLCANSPDRRQARCWSCENSYYAEARREVMLHCGPRHTADESRALSDERRYANGASRYPGSGESPQQHLSHGSAPRHQRATPVSVEEVRREVAKRASKWIPVRLPPISIVEEPVAEYLKGVHAHLRDKVARRKKARPPGDGELDEMRMVLGAIGISFPPACRPDDYVFFADTDLPPAA